MLNEREEARYRELHAKFGNGASLPPLEVRGEVPPDTVAQEAAPVSQPLRQETYVHPRAYTEAPQRATVQYVDNIDTGIPVETQAASIDVPKEKTEEELKAESLEDSLSFLRNDVKDEDTGRSYGMEGFHTKLYIPSGGKSGLTLGTGVDLKHWTKSGLEDAGVSSTIIDKLEPYLGKKDSKLIGEEPLTEEEVKELDNAVMSYTLDDIRTRIPKFDKLPKALKLAVIAGRHQYGATKFFRYKIVSQINRGDYLSALINLSTWEDGTTDPETGSTEPGDNISKKYQTIGKMLKKDVNNYIEEFIVRGTL